MRALLAGVMLAFAVALVALVLQVSPGTWDDAVHIITGAIAFVLICIGVAIATSAWMRGQARVREADALRTAAQARQAHGWPAAAPTYNVIVYRGPAGEEYHQSIQAGEAWPDLAQVAAQGWRVDRIEAPR